MKTLNLETRGHYQVVSLDRGKSNPINATMVHELREVIRECNIEPEIQGMILTGKENFFSAGLDVIELYGYSREAMTEFWQALAALISELAGSPKPWVAAISGHSPAGGCVLALCCDWRIMAQGKYKIGLNEVPVGIVIPSPIYHLYAHVLGPRLAHQYLLEGRLMLPEEALACGLVDSLVAPEAVLASAEAQLEKILALNPVTVQKSKQNMRQTLLQQLNAEFEPTFRTTLDQWWSPASRESLKAMVDRLQNKQG